MIHSKIILIALAILIHTTAWSQASQTTSQIHTLTDGITKIVIEVPSNRVEIFKTKGSRIAIETKIRLGAGSLPLLDYLIKSNRYEIKALEDNQMNVLTLSPITDQKVILIKGGVCPEIVTYKIHIPESVEYVETQETSDENFIAHH